MNNLIRKLSWNGYGLICPVSREVGSCGQRLMDDIGLIPMLFLVFWQVTVLDQMS